MKLFKQRSMLRSRRERRASKSLEIISLVGLCFGEEAVNPGILNPWDSFGGQEKHFWPSISYI